MKSSNFHGRTLEKKCQSARISTQTGSIPCYNGFFLDSILKCLIYLVIQCTYQEKKLHFAFFHGFAKFGNINWPRRVFKFHLTLRILYFEIFQQTISSRLRKNRNKQINSGRKSKDKNP